MEEKMIDDIKGMFICLVILFIVGFCVAVLFGGIILAIDQLLGGIIIWTM